MTKLAHYIVPILLMLFVPSVTPAQSYKVQYLITDSAAHASLPPLTANFSDRVAAADYFFTLLPALHTTGFVVASIDTLSLDSTFGLVHLYLGKKYQWAKILTEDKDNELLETLHWKEDDYHKKPLTFSQLAQKQEALLAYLEERGHPFGKVFLDSIEIACDEITARLRINKGPLYKLDSIRVYGDARVSNLFLQRYLDISPGSIYNKKKLTNVGKRLAQLPYVEEQQPATVSYLATGSVLNLYLKQRRNSQVNLLAGFLPNPDATVGKKFNFSIDANIMLRNALGGGEAIGLNWQKLQPQSQRLNLIYEQPYVFQAPFGLGFQFDMFRKDSTFLNINMRLGADYGAGEVKSGSVFLQRRQTIVNGVNAAQVLFTRQLPVEADVSSTNLGFSYQYNKTDYRLNPRKGLEFSITSSAGLKKIKKNNQVLELKDQAEPGFKFERLYDTIKLKTGQVRISAVAAHYIPVGKQSALKGGVQAGLYSSGNIYRNELFQIGGYRLLRGFDEESQYVSQYAVGTAEYRILLQRNSYFFAFADGGWARHIEKVNHTYLSTGAGISFETGAGIFNLALAIGSRDDQPFNLRQSKVHFGFVNYF